MRAERRLSTMSLVRLRIASVALVPRRSLSALAAKASKDLKSQPQKGAGAGAGATSAAASAAGTPATQNSPAPGSEAALKALQQYFAEEERVDERVPHVFSARANAYVVYHPNKPAPAVGTLIARHDLTKTLSPKQLAEARELRLNGWSVDKLAKKYEVHPNQIMELVNMRKLLRIKEREAYFAATEGGAQPSNAKSSQ